MLCKKCGNPLEMIGKEESFAVYRCASCGEETECCTACGTALVVKEEGMCIGMYCEQCKEYACVTTNPRCFERIEDALQSTRKTIIRHCLSYENVYEDYPFHDANWCVIRHKGNDRIFACIFEKNDQIWVNVKCDPQWTSFWRSAFQSVIPAYHMNKTHWNSIILNGSIPDEDVHRMIKESYDLTKKK